MAKAKAGKGRQRSKDQQAAVREARQAERQRAAEQKAERERARRRRRTLVQVGTGAAAVVVLAGVVGLFLVFRGPTEITDGPPGTDDTGAVVTGEESAPVTVEVISDFGCPACANFDLQTAPSLQQYVDQGQVRLEYRVVSALDRVSPNEYSSRAAAAGGCVLEQDDPEVWSTFKTDLFGSQPTEGEDGPSDTELIGVAVAAGADERTVTECIDGGERSGWADDVDSIAAGDYSATPSVAVAGERLTEPTPVNLQSAIDAAIAAG